MWISEERENEKIIKEIEASRDRAAAVLTCAFLEERLKERLRVKLRPNSSTVDNLLDSNGALGSLSAKNKMAYALGLYEKQTLENIETLGLIRNAFAHRSEVDSFESTEPKTLCLRLKSQLPYLMTPIIRAGDPLPVPEPRRHFMYVAQQVLWTLTDPKAAQFYVHTPSPEKSE